MPEMSKRDHKCPKSPHGKHSFMTKRGGINIMAKVCLYCEATR